MIKIWHSYSCNNSSSYRLIARFATHELATAVGAELIELVTGLEDRRNSGLQALSCVYGFDWSGYGSADELSATVDGELLIVHHEWCLGMGPGLPAYLTERGGTLGHATAASVQVSVLFRCSPDPRLDEALATITAQPVGEINPFEAPWVERRERGTFTFYRDAGMVGLWFPTDPRDLVRLRDWLEEHSVERPVILLDSFEDRQLFTALATARCTACGTTLEYLDPRLHDIESPQLVCRPCGGLYEVETFLGSGARTRATTARAIG